MSVKILSVSTHPTRAEWRNAKIEGYVRDSNSTGKEEQAIIFSNEKDFPLELGDLPSDWTLAENQYGPRLNPPKGKGGFGGGSGGGMAAFRNTEAGQKYEHERMNRRTALMQAVASMATGDDVLKIADKQYEWLQKGA